MRICLCTITLPVCGWGFGVYDHPPDVRLDLYSRGAFWRKEAKPITLGAGEDVNVDMEVPLGKLRTISGTVVAASDGHNVNLGTVTLSPQDDPEETRSRRSEETATSGFFMFLKAITLHTGDAAGGWSRVDWERHESEQVRTHQYGEVETTLHVGEESASATISVPERQTERAQ